jgi:hypothetical protein
MKNQNDHLLIQLLQTEWLLLDSSKETLLKSVEKCRLIGIKSEYSFEEQESFDSHVIKLLMSISPKHFGIWYQR